MTRRIAVTILLTVWAILLAGGVTTYLTIRAVLLKDLDASIAARAASLPQLLDENGRSISSTSLARRDDRYVIRNELGQTVARPLSGDGGTATANASLASSSSAVTAAMPRVARAGFADLPDGSRVRTVTLRAMGK